MPISTNVETLLDMSCDNENCSKKQFVKNNNLGETGWILIKIPSMQNSQRFFDLEKVSHITPTRSIGSTRMIASAHLCFCSVECAEKLLYLKLQEFLRQPKEVDMSKRISL